MDGTVWAPLGMEDTTLDTMTVVNSGNYAVGVTTLMKGKEDHRQCTELPRLSPLASHGSLVLG